MNILTLFPCSFEKYSIIFCHASVSKSWKDILIYSLKLYKLDHISTAVRKQFSCPLRIFDISKIFPSKMRPEKTKSPK